MLLTLPLHRRVFLLLLLPILAVSNFVPFFALGHGDHSHSSTSSSQSLNPDQQAKLNLFSEIVEHAAHLEAHLFPTGVARLDSSIELQNHLSQAGTFQLIVGLSRFYYRSLCQICGPQPIDEALFLQKILPAERKAQLAQKISRSIKEKIFNSVVDITLGSVDLGTRLGRTILILNVAWEVAETAISVFTPLKGAHLFCTPVQIAMTLAARNIQTAFRSSSLAYLFNEPGAWMFVKRALIASQVSSIFKSFKLEMGPFEIDPELAAIANENGYQSRRWFFLREGNRQRFAHWLDQKFNKNPTKNFSIKISRKEFLGSRYKRFLFITSRKKSRYHLASYNDPYSSVLQRAELWVLSLQEGYLNTLNRTVVRANELSSIQVQGATRLNPVFESILDQLSTGVDQRSLLGLRLLMKDVEFIFNPSEPKTARYLRAVMLESFFSSFIYRLLLNQWNQSNHEIENIWALIEESKNRYIKGQFARIASEFSDFLRVVASSGHPDQREDLLYESGDFLVAIFNYLQEIAEPADSPAQRDHLRQDLKILENSAPWLNRKVLRSTGWWPINIAPKCEYL